MHHRRLRQRWITIGAVALGAATVVAVMSTGSADALHHSHRHTHHHQGVHASSQPGLLQAARQIRGRGRLCGVKRTTANRRTPNARRCLAAFGNLR